MKTIHIDTKTDHDGHLRLDMPLANAVIGVSLTVVVEDAGVQSGQFNCMDLVGRLEWKGDAVSAQRRLRDEWS